MKRILFILLATCSMLQVMWGQETSKSNTQSPLVGEWSGIYTDISYKYKLIVRIDQYGQEIDVRIKTQSMDDNTVRYGNKCVVTEIANDRITFVEKGNEWYDKEDNHWVRFDYDIQLIYKEGKIHYSPLKSTCYYNGRFAYSTPLTEQYFQNIYLYPNDNW